MNKDLAKMSKSELSALIENLKKERDIAEQKADTLSRLIDEVKEERSERYADLSNIRLSRVVADKIIIVLTFEGEGLFGEYNADDPDDKPLLRLYINTKDAGFEVIGDSVLTLLNADVSPKLIEKSLAYISNRIATAIEQVETAAKAKAVQEELKKMSTLTFSAIM